MRKLVLQMQFSVDGFVGSFEHPGWQLWDWGPENPWDDDLKRDFNADFRTVDTILLSRMMAEGGYISHWSGIASECAGDPSFDFARRIGEVEKVIPTNKLGQSRWERTRVVKGDLAKAVATLKAQVGGTIIVFGGVGFARALIERGLVDELQFYINPAVLGSGIKLFAETSRPNLNLIGARAYSCGMVVGKYQVVPSL